VTENTGGREEVLRRIRAAVPARTQGEGGHDEAIPRAYLTTHAQRTPGESADLLAENLADYRARVHRTDTGGLPAVVAGLLAERGTRNLLVPPGAPSSWLASIDPTVSVAVDDITQSTRDLDTADTVITGCALAIAETGTIVLDGSPDQGRRRITLIPDHHICVIHAPDQIVDAVPQAMSRLDPTRPLTWISGPSATSDIELDRVEGVHGPRTLDVVLVTAAPQR
jgi:L-lactate dehydrogenase complex protein LldG